MWICKHCGSEVESDNLLACWNCGYDKDGTPPENREAFEEAIRDTAASQPSEIVPTTSGYASALKIFGWLALISGITGGLIVFSNSLQYRPYYPEPDTRPYYFALAFAVAFQGVFTFVLCHVIAEI